MNKVAYLIPINIVQDDADVIASKKQLAKRQAFATLNTELADDAVYVIRTSAKWVAAEPNPIFPGDHIPGAGTFTYTIFYQQWSNEQ